MAVASHCLHHSYPCWSAVFVRVFMTCQTALKQRFCHPPFCTFGKVLRCCGNDLESAKFLLLTWQILSECSTKWPFLQPVSWSPSSYFGRLDGRRRGSRCTVTRGMLGYFNSFLAGSGSKQPRWALLASPLLFCGRWWAVPREVSACANLLHPL